MGQSALINRFIQTRVPNVSWQFLIWSYIRRSVCSRQSDSWHFLPVPRGAECASRSTRRNIFWTTFPWPKKYHRVLNKFQNINFRERYGKLAILFYGQHEINSERALPCIVNTLKELNFRLFMFYYIHHTCTVYFRTV